MRLFCIMFFCCFSLSNSYAQDGFQKEKEAQTIMHDIDVIKKAKWTKYELFTEKNAKINVYEISEPLWRDVQGKLQNGLMSITKNGELRYNVSYDPSMKRAYLISDEINAIFGKGGLSQNLTSKVNSQNSQNSQRFKIFLMTYLKEWEKLYKEYIQKKDIFYKRKEELEELKKNPEKLNNIDTEEVAAALAEQRQLKKQIENIAEQLKSKDNEICNLLLENKVYFNKELKEIFGSSLDPERIKKILKDAYQRKKIFMIIAQ